MRKVFLFAVFLFATVQTSPFVIGSAQAQVSVDRVIVNFKHGERPIQNIQVRNGGEDAMYVDVVPSKMFMPGTENEARVDTEELIVSPRRFSIAGKGERTVRIILKEPADDVEKVYRIKFVPKATDFAQEEGEKKQKTVLRVIYSVGVLLFAHPKERDEKLKWTREDDNTLVFRNEGNVNVILDSGQYCEAEETNCEQLPSKRLYPGNIWKVPLPGSRMAFFRKRSGDSFEKIAIE